MTLLDTITVFIGEASTAIDTVIGSFCIFIVIIVSVAGGKASGRTRSNIRAVSFSLPMYSICTTADASVLFTLDMVV